MGAIPGGRGAAASRWGISNVASSTVGFSNGDEGIAGDTMFLPGRRVGGVVRVGRALVVLDLPRVHRAELDGEAVAGVDHLTAVPALAGTAIDDAGHHDDLLPQGRFRQPRDADHGHAGMMRTWCGVCAVVPARSSSGLLTPAKAGTTPPRSAVERGRRITA